MKIVAKYFYAYLSVIQETYNDMTPRLHHNSRSYSSSSTYDEIRAFFKGPAYLLLFKLPLFLVGIVLYAAYYIVKFVAVQLIKLFYGIIKSSRSLINDICYYIVLVCTKFVTFVWYWGKEFYENILQPIGYYMCNYIVPAISNAITWIAETIMYLCVQFFQLILLPTGRFSYIYIIVPTYMLFDYVSTALYVAFHSLFIMIRVACVWIWQNIIDTLCPLIYNYMLLPFSRGIVTICSFIHTQVLTPLGKLLMYIVQILLCWLYQLFVYAVRCMRHVVDQFCYVCIFIYTYMLLPFYRAFVTICFFVYTQVLTPVGRLLVYSAPIIRYQLYQFVLYPMSRLICTVGYFCYQFALQPFGNVLSAVSTTMVSMFNVIVHVVGSALNATGYAMATASKAVTSLLRSISNP